MQKGNFDMKNFLKSYNIFTVLFIAIIVLTVVCTPLFGISDMSEYSAVFKNIGLYNISDNTINVSQSYGISGVANPTSLFEMIIVILIGLNKLFLSDSVFNIHFIGCTYSIIFIISLYFLQKNLRFNKDYLNYGFSALLGIIFLDLGYIAYFNSFYSDAMIFVLVIAMTSLAVSVSRKWSYAKIVLFAILACILACMRFSAAVTALVAAIAILAIGFSNKDKSKVVCSILALVVAATSVYSMINPYVSARDVKLYYRVYTDLATTSDTALEELGIADRVVPENPTIDEMSEAVSGLTYGNIGNYYMKNPDKFFKDAKSAVNNSYFLIQDFAPYKETGDYYGIREYTAPKIWNFLKRTVIPKGALPVFAIILAYLSIAIREFFRTKKLGDAMKSRMSLFAIALPVGALAEFVSTVITTGNILISKNMFVFGVYFDLMIITAIMWVACTLIARREAIKEKYGVKQ